MRLIDADRLSERLRLLAADMRAIGVVENAHGVDLALDAVGPQVEVRCDTCAERHSERTRSSMSNIFCEKTNGWHCPNYGCRFWMEG